MVDLNYSPVPLLDNIDEEIMKQFVINSIISVFLTGALFLSNTLADSDNNKLRIELDGEYLTAEISNMPIIDVLKKISEVCGAEVFVDASIQNNTISANIHSLPVEKAVKRIVSPYSSVAVFAQRTNSKGDKELFISDIKVYESSSGGSNVQYVNVSKSAQTEHKSQVYQSPFRVPPPVPGVHAKGSYAEKAQKRINEKMIESRIKKIAYMRSKASMEENRVRKDITRLKIELSRAPIEDRRELSSELSAKTRELYNLQKRNITRIQNEERILRQLQARQH
ncbi:MAG: hypothetical protein OMM_00760 [Candidatus Magnetoglobus multicellularis str. Araruama]|uniref:Uncharacterized protein n=1 Tax=Candidatus Magnetoglobus multicellularis str. Araruama TaxID=890399 RepID=A0A1V1PFJ5_9BACT|nr:MAG: hypothetical protein OMM_00760 [Candidatus Magnetoglobus multicellularis str. Araruama]